MGRATKSRLEELTDATCKFNQNFALKTKELKTKLSAPMPHVSEDFADYEGFFVRDKKYFQLKTKSTNRDKQRLEFVRHAFHKFPVPSFMFNAWETQQQYQLNYDRTRTRLNSQTGFATKEDYRLWYICIATGGSLYKEYVQHLFTKKECHTFLNCKHNITIEQAIVYAIAYTESGDMGRALRIAKSKINTFTLNEFWREVVRFFARQAPKSKEEVDDIVDYILYKQRENRDFTILGKGHTIDSLNKKVEQWHQDLRRLKLIGDSLWEGIDAPDKEYSKKNPDGNFDYWKFTQIKSAKELQKEGNAMRHCVLSYKSQCIDGSCSIWSLTFNESRKLTIEVRGRVVKQIRGLANRLVRPNEKEIVKTWAKDLRFSYSTY